MEREPSRTLPVGESDPSRTTGESNVFEANETFDLKGALRFLWQACIHYWKLFLVCPLVCIFLIVVYIRVWPATFIAEVVFVSESADDSDRASFYSTWNTFRKDDLGTEVTLISSNQVVEPVIDELGLTYEQVYHPMMSHLVYLWGESWIGKTYRKVKYFFFPKKPSPYTLSEEEIERAKTIKDFKAGVSLEPIPQSFVGLMVVRGPSPEVATVANALADRFIEFRSQRFEEEARQAMESLEQARAEAYAELKLKEQEMKKFHLDNDLLISLEKDKVEISQYLEAKFMLEETKATIEGLAEKHRQLKEAFHAEPEERVAGRQIGKNPIVAALEAQISTLKTAIINARLRYEPDAPEVTDLVSQLQSMEARLLEEEDEHEISRAMATNSAKEDIRVSLTNIEAELASQRKMYEERTKSFEELEDRLRMLPNKILGLNTLERERAALEKKYYVLNERMEMAETSLSTIRSAPGALKIVDYASTPDKPVAPRTKLYLLAAGVLGLAVAFSLAIVIDLVIQPVTIERLNGMKGGSLVGLIHPKGGRKYTSIRPFAASN